MIKSGENLLRNHCRVELSFGNSACGDFDNFN